MLQAYTQLVGRKKNCQSRCWQTTEYKFLVWVIIKISKSQGGKNNNQKSKIR